MEFVAGVMMCMLGPLAVYRWCEPMVKFASVVLVESLVLFGASIFLVGMGKVEGGNMLVFAFTALFCVVGMFWPVLIRLCDGHKSKPLQVGFGVMLSAYLPWMFLFLFGVSRMG